MNRKPGTVAILACLLLSGCHVDTRNNGTNNNVDIKTPFGSLKVDTSDSSDVAAIGLSPYPGAGAAPLKDSGDKDDNSANVNMNFGSFRLGVKTASFQTSDPQAKVLAFYRNDLATHFGDVIECRGNQAVGTPTHTAQGLNCSDQKRHEKIDLSGSSGNLQLRSGSERHQHIVTVEDHDGGTKIGLIALDLPSHLSGHDGKDNAE